MKILLGALACAGVLAAGTALASEELAKKNGCLACHTVDKKLVGPPYKDVAKKYAGQKGVEEMLVKKVKGGSSGVWGPVPMPPNNISDADAQALVKWILAFK